MSCSYGFELVTHLGILESARLHGEDKTLEYWARSGSCYITHSWKSSLEMTSLGDVSEPWLRAGSYATCWG
ncbi:hypothetical protein MTR_5g086455 [Medicago truncatula]|uniref:Uncharacterized protein n=1 Tax=Medicago truncatula TaxID=3880 RepID=A0A072UF78_MEDTR|nr:hypothetical protein MTR_5g086455 [Medicago truncatula]